MAMEKKKLKRMRRKTRETRETTQQMSWWEARAVDLQKKRETRWGRKTAMQIPGEKNPSSTSQTAIFAARVSSGGRHRWRATS